MQRQTETKRGEYLMAYASVTLGIGFAMLLFFSLAGILPILKIGAFPGWEIKMAHPQCPGAADGVPVICYSQLSGTINFLPGSRGLAIGRHAQHRVLQIFEKC